MSHRALAHHLAAENGPAICCLSATAAGLRSVVEAGKSVQYWSPWYYMHISTGKCSYSALQPMARISVRCMTSTSTIRRCSFKNPSTTGHWLCGRFSRSPTLLCSGLCCPEANFCRKIRIWWKRPKMCYTIWQFIFRENLCKFRKSNTWKAMMFSIKAPGWLPQLMCTRSATISTCELWLSMLLGTFKPCLSPVVICSRFWAIFFATIRADLPMPGRTFLRVRSFECLQDISKNNSSLFQTRSFCPHYRSATNFCTTICWTTTKSTDCAWCGCGCRISAATSTPASTCWRHTTCSPCR